MTALFSILASPIVKDTDNVISVMQQIMWEVLGSKVVAFASLGAIVAAALAGFVYLKIAHDYMQGQGITLWMLLRPLVVLTCVCNFNSFVLGPAYFVCNIFTKGMTKQCSYSAQQYVTASAKSTWKLSQKHFDESYKDFVKSLKSIKDTPEVTGKADDSGFKQKLNLIKEKIMANPVARCIRGCVTAVTGFSKNMSDGAIDILEFASLNVVIASLLTPLMKLVLFGQQVFSFVYLILISLLGPFAFAFAILPSFGHSIQSWLARYVQTALWVPVGQLVMFVSYKIMTSLANVTGVSGGAGWITVFAQIACMLAVLSVPKICAYVIDSTGTNGAAGQAVNAMKEVTERAIKAAAAA